MATPRTTIVTNIQYKKPGQFNDLRELLKYLQYRDGSLRRDSFVRVAPDSTARRFPPALSDHSQPLSRQATWVNRGMGASYQQVAKRAHDWQGRSVLARTWVISPDPALVQHIPQAQHSDLLQRITERTIERWYGDNGWGQPEYSYVLHRKEIDDGGQTRHMPHAHVITPGTIPVDPTAPLGRIDHYVKAPHLYDLNETAQDVFHEELERLLGREQARQMVSERKLQLQVEERAAARNTFHGRLRQGMQLDSALKVISLIGQRKSKKRKRALNRAVLRGYASLVKDERRARWKRERALILQHDLDELRATHQHKIQHILERGQRVPTYGERHPTEAHYAGYRTAVYDGLLAREQHDPGLDIER